MGRHHHLQLGFGVPCITVLGFVGAGGLGMFIRMQVDVLDHQKAFGIIVIIIVLTIGSEVASHFLRQRFR